VVAELLKRGIVVAPTPRNAPGFDVLATSIDGRMTPAVVANDVYVPRLGRETAYFDWRLITSGTAWQAHLGVDPRTVPHCS
jgi:hypothetical protein